MEGDYLLGVNKEVAVSVSKDGTLYIACCRYARPDRSSKLANQEPLFHLLFLLIHVHMVE